MNYEAWRITYQNGEHAARDAWHEVVRLRNLLDTKPEQLSKPQGQQTKAGSLIESMTNIMIGYFVALASQLAIFPMFGVNIPFTANLWIGAWFTVISLVRSYIIRRWFNSRTSAGFQQRNGA